MLEPKSWASLRRARGWPVLRGEGEGERVGRVDKDNVKEGGGEREEDRLLGRKRGRKGRHEATSLLSCSAALSEEAADDARGGFMWSGGWVGGWGLPRYPQHISPHPSPARPPLPLHPPPPPTHHHHRTPLCEVKKTGALGLSLPV